MTDPTMMPHLSPLMALFILEKRLSRSGSSLGPLLALLTIFFRDTACGTLGTVTRRLIGPFRNRRPGRHPVAASRRHRGRSLRQWLCTPSHNEKNCRPSIFVHVSHNPPPAAASPASG